jgi:hypothetical protein
MVIEILPLPQLWSRESSGSHTFVTLVAQRGEDTFRAVPEPPTSHCLPETHPPRIATRKNKR